MPSSPNLAFVLGFTDTVRMHCNAGVKLPDMWVDNFLMVAQWRFPSFEARLLSIVVWSTATLNHRPQQDWLVSFEEQVSTTSCSQDGADCKG
jgi:hypothetical protein